MSMLTKEQEQEFVKNLSKNIYYKFKRDENAAPLTQEQKAEMIKELEQYPSAFVAACLEKGHGRVDYYTSRMDKYYTDASIHCTNKNVGPRCGYVVNMRVGVPVPDFEGPSRFDLLRLIDKSPKPVTLVIQVDEPDGMKLSDSNFGGQYGRVCNIAGVQNVICDGAIRDIDELESFGIQVMVPGTVASTAPSIPYELNGKVEVAGMEVEPGELVHMDRDGAVKFKEELLEELVAMCRAEKWAEDETNKLIEKAESVEECIRAYEICHLRCNPEKEEE